MVRKSKKYTLRFRAVNEDTFNAIKNGKKKIETRAGSPKYFYIQAGDILVKEQVDSIIKFLV